ncbi:MAG: 1,4-alpha-glucan branching enzyme, partial [Lachnospiraceae bacterium]|nr:1,4-alpha-glucan branching enzyme [Lachnospiraceae bacterium]
TPEDFMYFVDYMHQNGIGVILDWVPAHFPKDGFGLANFDGTCLYEHKDPRQGEHPQWGTLIYNYGRPEVSNFLIANVIFWAEKYHIDGIKVDSLARMLYLDYGKNYGEWIPNLYGGNENLDAVEFFKHLNSIIKKRKDGFMIIAEEATAWPRVTASVEENGLGFDYKWNNGWLNDFLQYMQIDPCYRSNNYNLLTLSMIYAYSEDFMLALSHDEVVHGKGTLISKMPGDIEIKAANLRAAYTYMMAHPGKKLLFMGQELAQLDEWYEKSCVDWNLTKYDLHTYMQKFVKALNKLYLSEKALYECDFSSEGFEWINCIAAKDNVLVFLRKTERVEDTLLVACNFGPELHKDYKVGVPFAGKYKEIFNTDSVVFGGSGETNPRLKLSKKEECDGRIDSITLKLPPMGVSILKYTQVVEEIKDNDTAVRAKRRTSAKTTKQVDDIRKKIMEDNQ